MGTVFKHKRQINRKHRHLNWDYHCIRLVERLILSEKSINIYWYLCIADHLNIMLNGEPKMESNSHEHNNTSEVFFKNWKIKLGNHFFFTIFICTKASELLLPMHLLQDSCVRKFRKLQNVGWNSLLLYDFLKTYLSFIFVLFERHKERYTETEKDAVPLVSSKCPQQLSLLTG